MSHCNHKDKNGKTLIIDGVCQRCGEEFSVKFINKIRDKKKINKKKGGYNSDY